uniref:Uncharacterized protein n=1 Tax=Picea glauca TaxID=3330 RepID=A0A101LWQ7_PICGL|nr:hypothetical protein ABT39_MTgene1675 [Picea glauca]
MVDPPENNQYLSFISLLKRNYIYNSESIDATWPLALYFLPLLFAEHRAEILLGWMELETLVIAVAEAGIVVLREKL